MSVSDRVELRRNTLLSEALFDRACAVLPGGNTRTTVFTPPHPIYAARGEGSKIIDIEGTKRIDFINNFTSLIHGHAHPVLVAAAREQLSKGTCFSLPTESEILLAEVICERVPSIEKIRFANSGTEAVMMAIKAARAFTGRVKIAKTEGAYHGSYDYVEVSQDSSPSDWGDSAAPASVRYSAGTPASVLTDVIVIPFNDVGATRAIIRAHRDDLAAIIVDPVPARGGLIRATPEYLAVLRELCDDFGIILVSDEIISFRVGYGGPQVEFGFRADLTTLGKIIGGGFPVGAVGGRDEVMAVFDPRNGKPKVPHGGTFNANPMTMVTGLAAMQLLNPNAFVRLRTLGSAVRNKLEAAFKAADAEGQIVGEGSLLRIHLTAKPLRNYRDCLPSSIDKARQNALYHELLAHGILIAPNGLIAISTVTSGDDVSAFASAMVEALRRPEFKVGQ